MSFIDFLLVSIDRKVVAPLGDPLIAPLWDEDAGLGQAGVEQASRRIPRRGLLGKMFELGQQERRLQLRQAVVGGQGIVQVARLVRATADAVEQAGPLRQRVVVGQDDAPFARG